MAIVPCPEENGPTMSDSVTNSAVGTDDNAGGNGNGNGCSIEHRFVGPEDIDLGAIDWDLDPIAQVAQDLRSEVLELRRQRSQLADALDRIDRGDGDDPTSIAAGVLAELGMVKIGTTCFLCKNASGTVPLLYHFPEPMGPKPTDPACRTCADDAIRRHPDHFSILRRNAAAHGSADTAGGA